MGGSDFATVGAQDTEGAKDGASVGELDDEGATVTGARVTGMAAPLCFFP